MGNYTDREPHINFKHPLVIHGMLTEKIFRLEQYAKHVADENLIDHAAAMMRIALDLQTAIYEMDKFKQRVELERQLVESVKQERDARQFERVSEDVK